MLHNTSYLSSSMQRARSVPSPEPDTVPEHATVAGTKRAWHDAASHTRRRFAALSPAVRVVLAGTGILILLVVTQQLSHWGRGSPSKGEQPVQQAALQRDQAKKGGAQPLERLPQEVDKAEPVPVLKSAKKFKWEGGTAKWADSLLHKRADRGVAKLLDRSSKQSAYMQCSASSFTVNATSSEAEQIILGSGPAAKPAQSDIVWAVARGVPCK